MTAISDYFRTALLIDDRAMYDDESTKDVQGLSDELDQTVSASHGVNAESRQDSGESDPQGGLISPGNGRKPESRGAELNANLLIKAFLSENIVCSVLKPKKDDIEDIYRKAVGGAKAADLLILDWIMFDDEEIAAKAVRKVLELDSGGLRVIVIYSGEPSLRSVAQQLVEQLEDNCQLKKETDFIFSKGDTKVLLFKKGKQNERKLEKDDGRTASYQRLPELIRQDLEELWGGLVPELAFTAVNSLRDSIPRILATFKSSLDAPLLTHRAMLPEVTDAGPQMSRLLASEFELALIKSRLTELLTEREVRTRLEQTGKEHAHLLKSPERLANRLRGLLSNNNLLKDLPDEELVKKAVTEGFQGLGLDDKAVYKLREPLMQVFEKPGHPEDWHERLAVLMNSTQFDNGAPRLEAGVVVAKVKRKQSGVKVERAREEGSAEEECRNQDNNEKADNGRTEYLLCIQPLCDSIRLSFECPRRFPFLPLHVTKSGQSADVMIPVDHMSTRRSTRGESLRFSSKPYELRVHKFRPAKGDSVVTATRQGDEGDQPNGAWYFESVDGQHYRAICRLRNEFTQQAVQRLTSGVARPGVDQSEWLRRRHRRGR